MACKTARVIELCKWPDEECDREVQYKSRGLCGRHYALARRHGRLDRDFPKPVLEAICKADDCTRPRVTKGYCHGHYVHHEYRGLTTPMGKPKHFLSEVNVEEETATCALCGPGTPVLVSRRRGSLERYARMCLSLYPGVQERALRRLVETTYMLSSEQRKELLETQGGTCANPVCDAPDDPASRWTRLSIDHDHDHPTSQEGVRGLLCRRCNAAIGMSPGDGLEGVLGLAVYLARHERPEMVSELEMLLTHLQRPAA